MSTPPALTVRASSAAVVGLILAVVGGVVLVAVALSLRSGHLAQPERGRGSAPWWGLLPLGVWVAAVGVRGIVRLMQTGGRLIEVRDGTVRVATAWRTVPVRLDDVAEVVVSTPKSNQHSLVIREVNGATHKPIFRPEGTDWQAVGRQLTAVLDGRRNGQ